MTLTDLLGLNKNTQQDPQEFSKLFFGKIDQIMRIVKDSNRPSLHQILGGQIKYTTKCNYCDNKSSQHHTFYELDLSIEGCSSLEEALCIYLSTEDLTYNNGNQYDCNQCHCRRDAKRSIYLKKTSSVLCFHLLRYEYDRQTYERKKLQTNLSFPNSIFMKQDTELNNNGTTTTSTPSSEGEEEYCLVSVIYHKGKSAYGGHYVCDVLDWNRQMWWHCDDETIIRTENPSITFLKTSSSSTATATTTSTTTTILSNDVINTENNTMSSKKRKMSNESKKNDNSNSNNQKQACQVIEIIDDDDDDDGNDVGDDQNYNTDDALIDMPQVTSTSSTINIKVVKKKNNESATSNKRKSSSIPPSSASSSSSSIDLTNDDNKNKKSHLKNIDIAKDASILYYVKRSDFDFTLQSSRGDIDLEQHNTIKSISKTLVTAIDNYQILKTKLEHDIEQRKTFYLSIQDHLSPTETSSSLSSTTSSSDKSVSSCKKIYHSENKKFQLIPTSWLQKWIIGDPSTFQSVELSKLLNDHPFKSDSISFQDFNNYHPHQQQQHDVNNNDNYDDKSRSTTTLHHNSRRNFTAEPITNDMLSTIKTTDIDTACYLCEHGEGLRSDALEEFKVVSHDIYDLIFNNDHTTNNKLNYCFTEKTYRCEKCFNNVVDYRRSTQSELIITQKILNLIDHDDNNYNNQHHDIDHDTSSSSQSLCYYWLSKQWLQQFRKYSTVYLHKSICGVKSKNELFFEKQKKTTAAAAAGTDKMIVECDVIDANHIVIDDDHENNNNNNNTGSHLPDPRVNVQLFCDYHHQPKIKFQKQARKISYNAWKAIISHYPDAMHHQIKETDNICVICQESEESSYEYLKHCKEAVRKELECPDLLKLSKAKIIYPAMLESEKYFNNPAPVAVTTAPNKGVASSTSTTTTASITTAVPMNGSRSSSDVNNNINSSSDIDSIDVIVDDSGSQNDYNTTATTTTTNYNNNNMNYVNNDSSAATINNNSDNSAEFYVIDGIWMSHWRKYLKDPSVYPGELTNHRLVCSCDSPGAIFSEVLGKIADGINPISHHFNKRIVYDYNEGVADVASTAAAAAAAVSYDENCTEKNKNMSNSGTAVAFHSTMRHVLPFAELITSTQWHELVRLYSPPSSSSQSSSSPSTLYTIRLKWDINDSRWIYTPYICQHCTEFVETAKYECMSNYSNTKLQICYVRDCTALLSIIEETGEVIDKDGHNVQELMQLSCMEPTNSSNSSSSGNNNSNKSKSNHNSAVPPTRNSGRIRRGKKTNRTIVADSGDSIAWIKLKICEVFDLPPSRQFLFNTHGVALHSSMVTLNEYNVKANDIIYVIDKKGSIFDDGYSNDDDYVDYGFTDCYNTHNASVNSKEEKGFHGSILSGTY